jgi:regulatory protein
MKITKIAEQVKNPNRVSVFVDGKYNFSLTLSQLLELRLKVGGEVDAKQLAKFKDSSKEGKLKMRALEWLIIRPRSCQEFADYLKRKGLKPAVIAKWLKDFTTKSYLGDEAFAKWWLEQRLHQQKSLRFIKFELRRKGVKSAIIDDVLANNQAAERVALKALVLKKRRLAKYQDNQKLTQYLLRQGYNYSSIKDVLTDEDVLTE